MRVSFSLIKDISVGLKIIFGRTRTSKTFSSGTLALSFSSFLEDEVFIREDSKSSADLLPTFERISAKSTKQNELYFGDTDIYRFVDNDSFNYDCQNEEDDKLERMKLILRRRGWNFGSQYGFIIDLNQQNIMRILNDIFAESRDASLALYFFWLSEQRTGSKHNIQSICTIIHILVAGNMNHRAMDLISCLVRKNDGEDWWHNSLVRALYETYIERKDLVTACSMLISCYAKENMTSVALKLACQMKQLNIFPSIGVCHSLVRALLGSGQLELAWDFLEEMLSQGLGINASIISLFISNYCNEGNLETGLKLLVEMKNYGINADIVAYTIVIDSLCKMSHLKEATSLLFKLTQMGISIDSVSVSSVIDGLCKVGEVKKAIDILKIFRLPPNVYVYNSFISKLCADGDVVAACNVFHEMSEIGLLPDCFAYTTIIGGYCKLREINKALEFLGKMFKSRIKPSVTTYTILIDGYCKSGKIGMAEHLFQTMITQGLVADVLVYNVLMHGYGIKGHLHKAFELLDMMRSANVSPDIVTYNTVIHGLILRGYVNEAKDLLDELIRRGFSPDLVTFTSMIDGFSKKGNFEEAFLVWFYMSEHSIKPDVVTCSALLSGYCKRRRMEEANSLFNKMIDVGLVPDLTLYNTLIHGYCSVGDIDNACHLVNIMAERQHIFPNEVTHRAFVLGFEKKSVKDPVEAAAFKLQQVLMKYNDIHIDVNHKVQYQYPSCSLANPQGH